MSSYTLVNTVFMASVSAFLIDLLSIYALHEHTGTTAFQTPSRVLQSSAAASWVLLQIPVPTGSTTIGFIKCSHS